MVKISVALDDDLVNLVRARAAERHKPTSRYIADLIVEDLRRHQEEIAAEGYRLLSEDTHSFADTAWQIVEETWPKWEQVSKDAHGKTEAR